MSTYFGRVVLTVPFVLQRLDGECLAACATMILHSLGLQPDYQRVKRLLTTTAFGAPFSNIRALAALGVRVHVRQGTLEQLHRHLLQGQPCIVAVRTGQLPYWQGVDLAHAIVVIGMDERFVYVHDPGIARHPMRVTHGDFDLAWLERDEEYAFMLR